MHLTEKLLIASVTSRPDCYWGKNCRTQRHNLDHARQVTESTIILTIHTPCAVYFEGDYFCDTVYIFAGGIITFVNKLAPVK